MSLHERALLKLKGLWGHVKDFVGLIGILGAIVGTFWAITTWIGSRIDSAVEKKLVDPVVLRKVAEHARPMMVFDARGRILSDMGAAQFVKVDAIKVVARGADGPLRVRLPFNRYFAAPPILTAMSDTATTSAERGQGFDWEFHINWIVAGASPTNDAERIYRLELIP